MSDRITIVATGDSQEALALRAMLESMNLCIRLLRETSAEHIASTLIRASADNVIILSGMTSKRGLAVGPDWVPMTTVFDGVNLGAHALLFSTGGEARESGLVNAMMTAGGNLVAPNGVPNRSIIVPWIGACLLAADNGLAAAVQTANGLVAPADRFSYG